MHCESNSKSFDLLIIGSGPAGCACAIQAVRDGLHCCMVGDEPPGGLATAAWRIDNLPGLPKISGADFSRRLTRQLKDLNVPVIATRIVFLEKFNNGFIASLAAGGTISARTVCLATGTVAKPWINHSFRKKIHRDIRSCKRRLNGIHMIVIGGGEAALDSAISARERGAEVTVLARRKFCGGAMLMAACEHRGIRLISDFDVAGVEEMENEWLVTGLSGQIFRGQELMACIGRNSNCSLIQTVECFFNKNSLAPAGLFLAGDITRNNGRFIAASMGDGQSAAVAASEFIHGSARLRVQACCVERKKCNGTG